MNREQLIHKKNDVQDEVTFSQETLNILDKALRSLAYSIAKKCIKEENIERYKDMKITAINPVYSDEENQVVDYYTYDVTDDVTGDTYENIRSKNFDGFETDTGYSQGSLVRVYVSNIVYIGFKL